ncbi:MAG: DUF4105 domain-containing protein [Bacteroidota bacterium]
MFKKIALLLFFINFSGFSQQVTISEPLTISILTVGTADESHSLYGHTALRIVDNSNHTDLVYNYGMFDFRTENFVLKFVKGDLQYFAAAYPYADFEYSYREENRSIYEQVLNLSSEEKLALQLKLINTLYSKDRIYTYKFIDRNCTTKVVDIINDVLKSKVITKKKFDSKTYRDVLFPYAKNHFFQKLGINIIFGTKVDNNASTIFLPFDLKENLDKTTYKNKALVQETKTLFEANRKPITSLWDTIYILIGALVLLIIINNKKLTIAYFIILGFLGLLFSVIGLYSFHKELLWNYNVLLFNPLSLVLVFFIIKNNILWISRICKWCLACIGIYTVFMLNKIHLLIVLPIIATTAIQLIRLIRRK